jgi:hypothetical protein
MVGGTAGLRAVAAGETRQRIGVRGLRVATAVLVLAAILAAGLI